MNLSKHVRLVPSQGLICALSLVRTEWKKDGYNLMWELTHEYTLLLYGVLDASLQIASAIGNTIKTLWKYFSETRDFKTENHCFNLRVISSVPSFS